MTLHFYTPTSLLEQLSPAMSSWRGAYKQANTPLLSSVLCLRDNHLGATKKAAKRYIHGQRNV